MDELKNPDKNKQAQDDIKRVEKVVNGNVKTKKKNEIRKFADVFISEDAANVKSYILMDVLVPAIKKAISDVVTNGIDMILYGGKGPGKKSSVGSKVSYGSFYKSDDRRPMADIRPRNTLDYDDIIFETRGDAEVVLAQMNDIIARYDYVRVLDLYDMAELTAPFTANRYGWTNLKNAYVDRVRDGYIIRLPRAMPLD